MATFTAEEKDPSARLPFTVDWSDWLETGESIASVSWTVPAGITQHSIANGNKSATIVLEGGTDGVTYNVACEVTTDAATPRIDERSIDIPVSDL